MNKKMIDMLKNGEATKELEVYVSAFLSVMFLVKTPRLGKVLYENLMSNNFVNQLFFRK